MRIAARATKGKGRRFWVRGQASSSNPFTKKHRSRAKRDTNSTEGGNLTVDAVATHNALNLENLKLADDDKSEKNTINTFASIWTQCTNPDFENFLASWTASSPLQKEMLAILGSAAETIKGKGGHQTTTEYFLVLMTMLEEVEGTQKVAAIVELLRIVVGKISVAVLRRGFDRFASILLKALTKFSNTSNHLLLRGLIHSLGIILRSLEHQKWSNTNLKLLEVVISFSVHSDANVRKSVRRTITGVISASKNDPNKNVVNFIASDCMTRMNEASVKDNVEKILYLMQIIKLVVIEMSTPSLKKTFETLLSFMTLENASLTICGLQTISLVFNSNSSAMTKQISVQVFNALFEFMPHITETEVVCAWMSTSKDIISYWKTDLTQMKVATIRLVKTIVTFFISDDDELQKKVSSNLIAILRLMSEFDFDLETVTDISYSIDSSLDFKYRDSWSMALSVIGVKFEVFSSKYPVVCLETLKALKCLRYSQHFSLEGDLDRAIGSAVKHLGPESVLQVIELDISPDRIGYAWILPILKQHTVSASLLFFGSKFIPMAQRAKQMSLKKSSSDETSAKHLEMIYNQIWSLLPRFCSKPNDVPSFGTIAPIIGRMLQEDVTIRSYILSSLRNIVKFVEANPDQIEFVAKYCKNFFPILFNIYATEFETTPKDNLLPVFETIQSFLRIADQRKILELHEKVLERYFESEDVHHKIAYLDLMRAFLPFLKRDDIESLFASVVRPLLSEKNCRLQKKGYRLIEELCRSSSLTCKDYVQRNLQTILMALIDGLRESSSPAKSACLNALRSIIVQFFVVLPDEVDIVLDKLIPMIFNAMEINSTRTRVASIELMKTLASVSMQNGRIMLLIDIMKRYLMDDTKADKTLVFLTSIYPQLFQKVSLEELLPLVNQIYSLTETKATLKGVIEFTKVALKTMPEEHSFRIFETVTDWISRLKPMQRSRCRIGIKDLIVRFTKKFGHETVSSRLPADLSRVVRNMKKKDRRKKHVFDDNASNPSERTFAKTSIYHDSSDESDDDIPLKSRSFKKLQLEENADDYDILENPVYKTEKKTKNETTPDDPLISVNEEGKIVIREFSRKRGHDEVEAEEVDDEEDVDSQARSRVSSSGTKSYKHGGKGIHRVPDRTNTESGRKFKSKNNRSDEKRKGVSVDPYAYLPLNRASLNKRRKVSMKKQFKELISRGKQ